MQERMFNIGKVINTHGVKGEVKVFRMTDFGERFSPGNTVYLTNDTGLKELVIDTHRVHKGFDLIQFKGHDAIDFVESFKGAYLQIYESQQAELEENAYYFHEIIGCDVFSDTGEAIGAVKDILTPGANDVWVIDSGKGKDILIPYIADVVKKVDTTHKQIVISPMEGLFD